MQDSIKKYLSKNNYQTQKLIIAAVISILIGVVITVTRTTFIWDRIIIIAGAIFFVCLHAIIPLKKMYGFIYDKRYWIALIFMVYVVTMGYSGSSIGVYSQVIQSESWQTYDTPILGKARSIRSDEWCVNMPIFISQGIEENTNKYGYYNDYLRGTKTDMFALVSPAVADIMIISKPFMIGYLVFGLEGGLSFDWYGKLVALMLISFEFCMMITKKNKLASLCGMLLITFSAATQWWNSSNVLIFGMLALVLIDKFMLSKKYTTKILCAIGIFIAGASYIFILYPAWQLSYGYIYLAIFIWMYWKNRKEYKINWKDVLIVLLVILAIAGLCVRYLIMSKDALNTVMHTDYPGERFEIGGDAKKIVYSYAYSYLFPYVDMNNPSELAGMISFFPIPMILACIYWIRNRKNAKGSTVFLVPLLLLSVIYGIWTHIPTNEFFAKITLLYMVPPTRMAVPLGFIQILLMVYLIGRIKPEDKLFGKKTGIAFTVLATTIIMYLAIQTDTEKVLTPMLSYICGMILLVGIYFLTHMNQPKYKNYLIAFLIATALITGTTVNPIQKGISVMREKPVAKEVQKIVTQDPENNLWLVDNSNFYVPNYILASGAKVINSTNVYPNKELFETVLGEEESQKDENRTIYNRYAHISVEITPEENKVELLYQDSIKLYISVEKVKELQVGYILTTRELEGLNNDEVQFEQIYHEQGLYIYQVQ